RVAITGIGIISCLGLTREDVQQSLREGVSGIKLLPERKKLGFQSGLSGVISGFNEKEYLNRKARKTLPEFGLWAWAAVTQALDQAGIDPKDLNGDERTGLIFGNDSSTVTAVEQVDTLRADHETATIGSGHIFRLLTSTITLNFSTLLGIHGMSWTVSGACASGAMAIGQAAELIAYGRQDRMICGGAQEISWQSMCSFDALGAFSRREDDPQSASRPFDQGRDGLVPSGGAAALILEEYDTAAKRGANILGEVLSYANTSDGHHIVVPSGEGLERAMHQAITESGLAPDDIDLVLAHATSTPTGDQAEALALRKIFDTDTGKTGPMITAVKGLSGHEFWMAGASQAVYGLLMAHGGFVAGNPNLKFPDSSAKNLRFPLETSNLCVSNLLLNAAGFGGTNACLIIKIIR
ncbi:MAG: beta-ketoacyl-[acyl-carrier-protein] synthase family protein, partial [Proteobacteria bacterium]|nr:beta-ketoacyl-[acyl-carrier-protein] synthase family protein [Pseudomonadota bacterium]